jgi:hypothetical protein
MLRYRLTRHVWTAGSAMTPTISGRPPVSGWRPSGAGPTMR